MESYKIELGKDASRKDVVEKLLAKWKEVFGLMPYKFGVFGFGDTLTAYMKVPWSDYSVAVFHLKSKAVGGTPQRDYVLEIPDPITSENKRGRRQFVEKMLAELKADFS